MFIIKDNFQTYMHRPRLDPADPNSALIGNIQKLHLECIRKWNAWSLRRSGIYTEFYHKMNELFDSVCYTSIPGGGTLHIDYDRTKTNAAQIKRLIDEAHAEWFKLSEEQRRKFPETERLLDLLYHVPDYNPPEAPALRDNPGTRRHRTPWGANPNAVQTAQLLSMLQRVQHSMRWS